MILTNSLKDDLKDDMKLERTIGVLAKVFGEEKAEMVAKECLSEAGLTDITCPQEMLRFGQSLVKRGGFVEVVGRSMVAKALLAGARLEA